MYFDRFDICEALNLLAHDFGLYDLKARLDDIPFKCGPVSEFYEGLTDNGKAIYRFHFRKIRQGDPQIKSRFV